MSDISELETTNKRMLINASQAEEVRVALVSGLNLYNLDIENTNKELQKSNIFKAKVTRIERSLGAVFADFGAERHGFLSGKEIALEYCKSKDQSATDNTPVLDLITEGQELIVQIEKEQRGNKGAALTTFISLAGCYLVLMPNNPKAGGISKRIEGEERSELKELLQGLQIPDRMGVIIRTAGIGRSIEELQWDLDILLKQWQAIQDAANSKPAPFLIYQESNLIIRCIRDYLRADIEEILIDDSKVFDMVFEHMRIMRPDFLERIKLYNDTIPLFSKFQIESQIESAYQREVQLKSGGALVIDHTEALISIDINSAKATKGADIEETAVQTNLEACEEIARQLRLRDLGGLIVIDFIDMSSAKNQREVEQKLRHTMLMDRAKVQVGKISRFGLLEMSRQRLRSALSENIEVVCPRCSGKGTIRNIATLAINIIRVIEEHATEEQAGAVIAELPIEIAAFLMNEKRVNIANIEKKHHKKILIIPNKYLNLPNYHIKAIKTHELQSSYNLANQKDLSEYDHNTATVNPPNAIKPAVNYSNIIPAPQPINNISINNNNFSSLIKKLWQILKGSSDNNLEKPKTNVANNQEKRKLNYSKLKRNKHHRYNKAGSKFIKNKNKHHNKKKLNQTENLN